ncbi:GNAT family N-acetyltransferase [Streptococcus suis]|nr:GNAT family N-acetyltransferase [Streptococcus suis]
MLIRVKLAKFATVETERLLLRPFAFDDLEDFAEIVLNPKVMTFIHPGYQTHEEAATLLVTAFMSEPLGKWAIVDKASGKVIGAIRLENYNEHRRSAEIGYFLAEADWQQGFMTESLKTLTFLCFQEFGMTSLQVIVHEENVASRALAEACHFTLKERFKGSDRYTHKMRRYSRLELRIEDYRYE